MNASIKTLVVDDDYRVAGIHAAYVAQVEGFHVEAQAHTAAAAWDLITTRHPDLVLLDIYLPDQNGLALARRLAELPGRRPDVIVITAARDVRSVRESMQLGAMYYLVKPFGFAALRDRLTAYRELRARLTRINEAGQDEVDRLFRLRHSAPAVLPPKGHSAPTMELVRDAVLAAGCDVSAAEVATLVGISRPTAQRYLSYLVEHGVLDLKLRYGTTGRPEHRYRSHEL